MTHPLDLLNAHLDGKTLTAEEARRLSEWVVADSANATAVVEMGMVNELLDSIHSVPRLLEQLAETDDREVQESISSSLQLVEDSTTQRRPAVTPQRRSSALLSGVGIAYLATAACVLLAVGAVAFTWFGGPDQQMVAEAPPAVIAPVVETPPPAVVLATITESLDVEWNLDRRACRDAHLRQGETIELKRGVLAAATTTGCDLLLQAPVVAEILEGGDVRLLSGRLTARVGSGATGLTVMTPTANVVDLGTEFGVHVSDNQETSVAVYEGLVELSGVSRAGELSTEAKPITAGRAGHVNSEGEVCWTVETLLHDRDFIRFDELAAIREARQGSRDAQQQVCFYELQRTAGLLGFHGFDVPSEGAAFSLAFQPKPVRSDSRPAYTRDITSGRFYTSGALEVVDGQRVFLDLDTSSDSPFARAGLVNKQGLVGRSDTELWISWRSQAADPSRVETFAGVSLMFGDERQVQEPLLLGVADGSQNLTLVANLGSRVTRKDLDATPEKWPIDPRPLTDQSHHWLVRLAFGERADKVTVWCDTPPREALHTRPHAELVNANVTFDRLSLAVGRGGAAWRFDDFVLCENADAVAEALDILYGDE